MSSLECCCRCCGGGSGSGLGWRGDLQFRAVIPNLGWAGFETATVEKIAVGIIACEASFRGVCSRSVEFAVHTPAVNAAPA